MGFMVASCGLVGLGDEARIAFTLTLPPAAAGLQGGSWETGSRAIPETSDEIYVQIVDGVNVIDSTKERIPLGVGTMEFEAQFRPGTFTVHVFALKGNCIIGIASTAGTIELKRDETTALTLTMTELVITEGGVVSYDEPDSTPHEVSDRISPFPDDMYDFFFAGSAKLYVKWSPDWLLPMQVDSWDDADSIFSATSYNNDGALGLDGTIPDGTRGSQAMYWFVIQWPNTDVVFTYRLPDSPDSVIFQAM
ncbi:MAG: hypothetical protein NT080_13475 [Spirochaetes bacterium]|nr:hypothetical protein [Spirochaetota bacterium]